jgi:hypothetical protein
VGGILPAGTAALVSYPITRHYRGGHPRSYLPVGVESDLLTQTSWSAAFVTAVRAAWAAVKAQLIVGAGAFAPISQVNVSYYGGAPPVAGHSVPRLVPISDAIAVDALVVSNQLASQRRRTGRR